jgi:hypothetical protein
MTTSTLHDILNQGAIMTTAWMAISSSTIMG